MKYRFEAPMLSSLAILLGTVALQATPLAPGGTVAPVPISITTPTGNPVQYNSGGDTQGGLAEGFSWKQIVAGAPNHTAVQGSGVFINAIYKDPTSGGLDFYYQLQNTYGKTATNANTLISSFQLTNWAGVVITAVNQLQKPTTGGYFGDGGSVEFAGKTSDNISSVVRSGGLGGNLTINLKSVLKPGQKSSILLIKTTAHDFDLGSGTFNWVGAPPVCNIPSTGGNTAPCGVADTQTFGLGALEPVVPEPGFYGVLALGMAALWIGVHRRSSKAKA